MEIILAILAGVLTTTACWLLLDGNRFRLLLGVILLGQAANLVIFVSAGVNDGTTAIVNAGERSLGPEAADPLAQAMILTAIVIGFAVSAFCLFLIARASSEGPADSDTEVDKWPS